MRLRSPKGSVCDRSTESPNSVPDAKAMKARAVQYGKGNPNTKGARRVYAEIRHLQPATNKGADREMTPQNRFFHHLPGAIAHSTRREAPPPKRMSVWRCAESYLRVHRLNVVSSA